MKNLKVFKIFIVSSILCFQSYNGFASHFMAGQITYKWVSGNTYKFTLKLYQDCNGVEFLNNEVLKVLPAVNGSDSTIILNFIDTNDITIVCPGQVSVCQDAGSGYPYGVREWIYEGTQSLPPLGGNNVYVIAHGRPARNDNISTIDKTPPCDERTGWYIKTTLNPDLNPKPNSPEFLNSPIGFIPLNKPYTYNHNVYDVDGDSLVFSLTECLSSDWNTNPPIETVCYIAPYNATYPMSSSTPFLINSKTGEISFNPNINNQAGIMAILVEEYRNGVKIGEVRRDVQLTVQSCDNELPEIQPWGNDSTDTTIYAGTNYCFYFRATDADFLESDHNKDLVALSITSGIPGGTWSNPSPAHIFNTGTYCWTPTCNDVRSQPYLITVIANDFACFLPGLTTKTFEIYVKEPDPIKPKLLCVSDVNNDTNLEITWEMPERTITGEQYYVNRAININGPYQTIDTISNIGQLVFTDNTSGLSPKNTIYYYHIKNSSPTCSIVESLFSDSVSNIKLTSSFNDPLLTLSWNQPSASYKPVYKIMRKISESFILYDTTSATTYIDSITSCTPMYLEHRIDVDHPTGKCISLSNTAYDTVPGGIPPPPVQTICKTEVNIDNSVTVVFNSDTTSIKLFIIYRYNSLTSQYDSIGIVTNLNQLLYIDSSIDASKNTFSYKIAALDSCGFKGKQADVHQTIDIKATAKHLSNNLNWNKYINWNPDSINYLIYRSDSLPLNFSFIQATADTSFTDSSLKCNKRYYYRIYATYTGNSFCDSVLTDTVSSVPFDSILPLNPSFCNISVQANIKDITMKFNNSQSNDVISYELYRVSDSKLLSTYNYNLNGYSFVDSNIITAANNYGCYYVVAVDSCENRSIISDTLCSIDLTVTGGDRKNLLQWTDNSGFQLSHYAVYRGLTYPLDSIGISNNLSYVDSALPSVCKISYIYQIKAVYNDTLSCNVTYSDTGIGYPNDSLLPLYPLICNLTVQPGYSDVFIDFGPSTSTDIESYELYRSGGILLSAFNTDSNFIDKNIISTANQSQCYYLISKDTCGNTGLPSPDYCTINLTANPGFKANYLSWNNFTPWLPDGYKIYTNTSFPLNYLATTQNTRYVHASLTCRDKLYYQIEAFKLDTSNGCYLSESDTASSLCSDFELPNVFTPNNDNVNDLVIPIIAQNVVSIDFTIYNRWGEEIYYSTDIANLWDGTNIHNNRHCSTGVYFYIADVKIADNTELLTLRLKGHITLLR